MTAPDRSKALDEATRWFARLRDAPIPDEERRRFELWRDENLAHRRAYEEIAGLWDVMDCLEPVTIPGMKLRKSPMRHARRAAALMALAMAGAVVLSLLGIAPWSYERYVTGPGEQRTLLLADGTTVYMNTRTRLAIALDSGERRVRLLEGEALFDVERDETRPFRIDAGASEVRVLGTRFNVRRLEGRADIAVIEGLVAVSPEGAAGDARELHPGEAVSVGGEGVGAVVEADLQAITAWRDGRLIYRGTPLSAVVADLNRYLTDEVRLGDDSIRDLKVTAVIRIEDREAILRALDHSLPIERVTLSNGVTMLYDKRGKSAG